MSYNGGVLTNKYSELLNKETIKNALNNRGFSFRRASTSFDLIDDKHSVVIAAKSICETPQQALNVVILMEEIGVNHIGLTNVDHILFFHRPSDVKLQEFRNEIGLNSEPTISGEVPQNFRNYALRFFGAPIIICDTKSPDIDPESLSCGEKIAFTVVSENLHVLRRICKKYELNMGKFIGYLTGVESNSLKVNEDGWIIDIKRFLPFRNHELTNKTQQQLVEFEGDYKRIVDWADALFIESLRIDSNYSRRLMKTSDEEERIEVRREYGRFFTSEHIENGRIGEWILNVCRGLNPQPDLVIEPYVGSGNLISSIIDCEDYIGVGNDIASFHVDHLFQVYNDSSWIFTDLDVLNTKTVSLIQKWKIDEESELLLLTNPPYGDVFVNETGSKRDELKEKNARRIKLTIPDTLATSYGKRDIVLPAIGKLIDLCKARKKGGSTLAFFSPHALFCGKMKYNRLYRKLLKDFRFVKGFLFSGKQFNSVSEEKTIAFTIWRYHENINTDPLSVSFHYNNDLIQFKEMPLLKDHWRYRDGNKRCKHKSVPFLGVKMCVGFNTLNPKFITMFPSKKARERQLTEYVKESRENLEKLAGMDREQLLHKSISLMNKRQRTGEANVAKICSCNLEMEITNEGNWPSELILSLWSTIVGHRSMTRAPLHFDNTYVHLPDFEDPHVMEIVTLGLVYVIIEQIQNPTEYSEGNIGFKGLGSTRKFQFKDNTGDCDYSNDVIDMIEKYAHVSLRSGISIKEIYEELRDANVAKEKEKFNKYRTELKKEVQSRVEQIGYFGNYMPFPMHFQR